jgi:hypothetical protein
MNASTDEDTPIVVTVRFSTADLYQIILRGFVRFPAILGFLLPVAFVAFFEGRGGRGFYLSCTMLLFFFGVLPVVQVLRMRNHPGIKSDTQHGFSATSISTIMGPISNFADWSFARDAKEDNRHITVRFKSGAVLLPKNQLGKEDITAIRAVIRQHLQDRAVLW